LYESKTWRETKRAAATRRAGKCESDVLKRRHRPRENEKLTTGTGHKFKDRVSAEGTQRGKEKGIYKQLVCVVALAVAIRLARRASVASPTRFMIRSWIMHFIFCVRKLAE
jgi:hypothetical protein